MGESQAIKWSEVLKTEVNIEKLNLLTATPKLLSKEGYVFTPLSEVEIQKKIRCATCGQRIKINTQAQSQQTQSAKENVRSRRRRSKTAVAGTATSNVVSSETAQLQKPAKHECIYHFGDLFYGKFKCCDGHMFSKGCASKLAHDPCGINQARHDWLYHHTPQPVSNWIEQSLSYSYTESSALEPSVKKQKKHISKYSYNPNTKDIRTAVALDCEMGTPKNGTSLDNVLIRLSMVDFFTGESLIDKLVLPDVDMLHYNTKYSGVTYAMMRMARQRGEAIRGVDAARELVFKYVDASTIVILHGGSSDMSALPMIHPPDKIIDTHIIERKCEDVWHGELKANLKDVCMRRCSIEVQNAKLDTGKKAGHDSLEDAMATREIVCAWLKDMPDL